MRHDANFEALGLSSDASWDEVKTAFRKMARLYHPDVAGPEGTRKFTEITEAYMTLKETISPGVTRRETSPSVKPTRNRSFRFDLNFDIRQAVKSLWDRITAVFVSGVQDERFEQEEEISPARARFIGSAISRAEAEIYNLMSRRGVVNERNRNEAILRRLRSKHPGVVLLALKRISSGSATDDIRKVVLEHFRRNVPTSEVLESLLAMFSTQAQTEELAQVLLLNAPEFSNGDVMIIMKWMRRKKLPAAYYSVFLTNSSDSVIASVLSNWPQNENLPDSSEVFNLLKKEDEAILLPLLRLLKKGNQPIWVISAIAKISREHKSPAVRVWASAIVREQNTS
ncbi:MAG: DnaJ domain-containing protein [Synergistaceae bacterium]|jgi:hypothetical protein|nr:DnaJ domain-containing protein [Synergistaceae bacterium]